MTQTFTRMDESTAEQWAHIGSPVGIVGGSSVVALDDDSSPPPDDAS